MEKVEQGAKSELRLKIRAALAKISPEERVNKSFRLCERLREQFKNKRSILFFAPLDDEPDIWPLVQVALDGGKMVCLPRFDPGTKTYLVHQIDRVAEDIVSGKFGIREPKIYCPQMQLNRLDLALVPGVGFDLHGRRLGRGKGFYDRLLAAVRGVTCGVAFDEQIVARIPVEPHDISVKCILTPTRWIEP